MKFLRTVLASSSFSSQAARKRLFTLSWSISLKVAVKIRPTGLPFRLSTKSTPHISMAVINSLLGNPTRGKISVGEIF